jgi:hypothetical protein
MPARGIRMAMVRDLDEYDAWIADYIASGGRVTAECMAVCKKMKERFPELILHGGYVHTPLGPDLHYWLMTEGGELVDPTASQFEHWGLSWPEDYENAGTTDPMQLLRRFIIVENEREETPSGRSEVPLLDRTG